MRSTATGGGPIWKAENPAPLSWLPWPLDKKSRLRGLTLTSQQLSSWIKLAALSCAFTSAIRVRRGALKVIFSPARP